MGHGVSEYTTGQIGIIEIYGQILKADQDWHDTDYLERVVLLKYSRKTALAAIVGLLAANRVLRTDIENVRSLGEVMLAFVETRVNRFVWKREDFIILSDEESRRTKHSDWPGPGARTPRVQGNEELAKTIDNMTSALSKGRTPENLTTYRAVVLRNDEENDFFTGFKVKRVIEDRAFLSTTLDAHNLMWVKNRLLVAIQVPKGVPSGYLAVVTSTYQEERELVLQRGTRLRILDIDRQTPDRWRATLRVLPATQR